MIYEFALNFNAVTFGGVPRTVHTPGREGLLRITKPLAAASGGKLQFDAWSAYPDDTGVYPGGSSPVPGQTWGNSFEVWASKGGAMTKIWDAEDEGFSPNLYATAAQAYAAINALLPIVFTGYDAYEIRSQFDNNPGDNRGGISLVVEVRSEAEGRELLQHIPDAPIEEEWSWLTDVATAYDGSETRIPLLRYPRRRFSGNLTFDRVDDVRNHVAMMLKNFDKQFRFPLFQFQAKLKAKANVGASEILCNARRGNFRPDVEALIMDTNGTWEIVVPRVVAADKLTLQTNLRHAYSARAIIMPITKVYTETNASITRKNPDHSATSSFNLKELLPTLPFVPPLNDAVVATFDGLPLVPYVPVGTGFDATLATGLTAMDYTGRVDLISPWTLNQWAYNLSFKASHLGASKDFAWWQKFAEAIQGSFNPFLLPTNRADLPIVTPANGGGNTVVVLGDSYSEYYFDHPAFQRIFIDSDAGRHYAKITALSSIGGNDRLTFAPALPAGAGWNVNQKVGFLVKLRNDNDKISCKHYGLWTEVSMAARTVE